MRRIVALALILTLATASAGERMRTLARWSRVAITVAAAADAATSYGRPEANPLLRSRDGRFALRGVGIKFGALGAWLLIQRRINRGEEPVIVWGNFISSAFVGSVAIRNARLSR